MPHLTPYPVTQYNIKSFFPMRSGRIWSARAHLHCERSDGKQQLLFDMMTGTGQTVTKTNGYLVFLLPADLS